MYGYWTSTANASDSSYAWYVSNKGTMDSFYCLHYTNWGVRPVIEVLKTSL